MYYVVPASRSLLVSLLFPNQIWQYAHPKVLPQNTCTKKGVHIASQHAKAF